MHVCSRAKIFTRPTEFLPYSNFHSLVPGFEEYLGHPDPRWTCTNSIPCQKQEVRWERACMQKQKQTHQIGSLTVESIIFPRPVGRRTFSCIPQAVSTMVDATERLQVILTQEATFYKTSDYLTRMQSEPEQSSEPTLIFSSSSSDAEATSPNRKRKSLLCTDEELHSFDGSPESPKAPKRINSGAASTTSSEGSSSQINKHWREKICEWAYQGK